MTFLTKFELHEFPFDRFEDRSLFKFLCTSFTKQIA